MENAEKEKIKIICPFRSYTTSNGNSNKIAKKFKKSKIPLWLPFKPKQVEKGQEEEKIKIIIPLRSYPTRNRKFQKNSKKIQKTKKYPYGFISSINRLEKSEKKGK